MINKLITSGSISYSAFSHSKSSILLSDRREMSQAEKNYLKLHKCSSVRDLARKWANEDWWKNNPFNSYPPEDLIGDYVKLVEMALQRVKLEDSYNKKKWRFW